MSAAYYNEFDPYAAQWLRNLIAAGHIAPGEVDEMGKLRGFGNAIVPQVAAAFIGAYLDIARSA